MMQEKNSALYNRVKDLYDQAKSIWKGVVFEILLDPINPEPGETAERHIIDYRDCIEDFELNDGEPGRELSLDELFNEIGKLRDYKNILKAASESIENIKEQYKNKYTVTLLRVMDYSDQENQEIDIFESESEIETEVEEDAEAEDEWDDVWESDSGVESPAEYEQQPHLYSSEESEVDNESDSGLQTESDPEDEWLSWESGSESDHPASPEPNEHQECEYESDEELIFESNQNEELELNWESDSESNSAEISICLEYESDEEIKTKPCLNERQFHFDPESNAKSLEHNYDDDHETSEQLLSSMDISEKVTLNPTNSKLGCERESTYYTRIPHKCAVEFVLLGPNCTSLAKSMYENIPWNSARSAANALLFLIFGGKISPRSHLNQRILADIQAAICLKCNISEHEAQNIIETQGRYLALT